MIKKKISSNNNTYTVTFKLAKKAAPEAKSVLLLGEFNDWEVSRAIEMKVKGANYQAEIKLDAGRSYEFRYLIDHAKWENDWNADRYVPAPYENIDNSVVDLHVSEEKPVIKKAEKPRKMAAKPTKADDLKKIEGVGPKIAGIFKEKGIISFADLASAEIATLKGILTEAGSRYKMHDPKTWPQQAKLAAEGLFDELKALQANLKGGK